MKTYTINNVSVSEEDLKKIIRENPSLVEMKKSERYFKPVFGDRYWYIKSNGFISEETYERMPYEEYSISRGNCYRTREDAELALDKEKALVRLWNWAEENASFEPDWSDNQQKKWYAFYDYMISKLSSGYFNTRPTQFTLPHFATEKDCDKFIKANLADLQILWGIK